MAGASFVSDADMINEVPSETLFDLESLRIKMTNLVWA